MFGILCFTVLRRFSGPAGPGPGPGPGVGPPGGLCPAQTARARRVFRIGMGVGSAFDRLDQEHDSNFQLPEEALTCGHTYHEACIKEWIEKAPPDMVVEGHPIPITKETACVYRCHRMSLDQHFGGPLRRSRMTITQW